MSSYDLKGRLSSMQETIRAIEQEVSAGSIPPEGTEDFKRAVDEARMRIWAILTASNDADPAGFLERFRLRRAIEICRGVDRDLDDGAIQSDHAEVAELAEALRELGATISAVRRR